MLQKIIHRLLLRRHFWRYATFSEVAELYASRTLRMMAIGMTAIFMSVFLYQNGYSVLFIAGYWVVYYCFKFVISLPSAKYAAVYGPKHGILLSNLLYIPSMVLFSFTPQLGLAAIVITGLLQAVSTTLYDLCHLIDFSRVKNVEHAGKEIAYMNIFDKAAKSLSPLLGGAVAVLISPQATMWTAALLFLIASLPLFKTGEPIATKQRLVFRGFPWRLVWRSFVAEVGVGFDLVSSTGIWLLMVAVLILGTGSNQVYVELGALMSVVLVVALLSSYLYGLLIDKKRGGQLLKIMATVNASLHLVRPFIQSPGAVVGMNAVNEVATTGYAMAFMRGIFDTADLSGHRVTYLGCIEMFFALGMVLAAVTFFAFVALFGDEHGMRLFFFVAAPVTLLIASPKFRLYQK